MKRKFNGAKLPIGRFYTVNGMTAMAGHRQFIGAPRDPKPFDRQAEAIQAQRHERARRVLWLDCERRPLSMDREIA